MILVNSMSERKQLLESSADGFVILPGSYGTMDEFFEMMTDAQLGLHCKPIAIVNAEGYYDHLIHGEYEQFLEGANVPEDPEYRSQLLDNYRQFMASQKTLHGGIREVRIVRAKTDSIQQYTNVFLTLCFGDSTNEEIVVPMVDNNGRWRMR